MVHARAGRWPWVAPRRRSSGARPPAGRASGGTRPASRQNARMPPLELREAHLRVHRSRTARIRPFPTASGRKTPRPPMPGRGVGPAVPPRLPRTSRSATALDRVLRPSAMTGGTRLRLLRCAAAPGSGRGSGRISAGCSAAGLPPSPVRSRRHGRRGAFPSCLCRACYTRPIRTTRTGPGPVSARKEKARADRGEALLRAPSATLADHG